MHNINWTLAAPYPSAPSKPEGLRARMLCHFCDEFPFLHDTSISLCQGGLFIAWYACTQGEIEGATRIVGRFSPDGEDWRPLEIVEEGREYHYVPASFFEENRQFRAVVTVMTGHDRPIGFDELLRCDKGWEKLGSSALPFLFNTTPITAPDGALIAGGRFSPIVGELPRIPAIIRRARGESDWRLIRFPGEWDMGAYPLPFPETAILPDGGLIEAIVRNDNGQPRVYRSSDAGLSWAYAGESDLPAAGSKLYGGRLSDGRQYLIFNERTPARDRSRLVMALRDCSDRPFDRLLLLADGWDSELESGPYWHYPWACEYNGRLYVSCTSNGPDNRRNAVLFDFPLASV